MIDSGDAGSTEAARAELGRILASADFDTTERNRQFLEYIVEETLAGRANRIKAYSIATAVFGRDSNFDPQMDAIVRIEARRLRRSLERYYLTAGREDPVRISIPKGSYVPVFEIAPAAAAPAEAAVHHPATPGRQSPSIFVAQFEEDGFREGFPNLTRGFVRQVIVALTRFNDLFVYGPETSLDRGRGVDIRSLQADLDVDFVLTGATTLAADRFGVEALLIDARNGQTVWAEGSDRELKPDQILTIRDEMANGIARTLAQPYGVIYSNRAQEIEGQPPESLSSYACVIRFYHYWRSYSHDLHESVRACLERAILSDPGYAEAYACLSQVYSNAYRFGYNGKVVPADPLQRALDLAQRAVELAPRFSHAYHALSLAYWFDNNVRASLEALRTGLDLNPNDTAIMADLGFRYALLCDWERAVPLLEGSYRRNPAQPGSYRVGLSLYHYLHGRYAEALSEASRVNVPNVVYGFVAEAMALAQLGRRRDVEHAVRKILAIDAAYGSHVVEDLEKRNVHPELIRAIVDGLRKAGLPGLGPEPGLRVGA